MRRYLFLAANLTVLLLCTLAFAQARRQADETLAQQLARTTKLTDEVVDRLLRELGPAMRDQLANGKEVALTGLGKFRVMRIEAHKDLREGRPVVVPARNIVEFVADGAIETAVNAETAKPSGTVPEFKYTPLPNQTPGQKVGRTRTPGPNGR